MVYVWPGEARRWDTPGLLSLWQCDSKAHWWVAPAPWGWSSQWGLKTLSVRVWAVGRGLGPRWGLLGPSFPGPLPVQLCTN